MYGVQWDALDPDTPIDEEINYIERKSKTKKVCTVIHMVASSSSNAFKYSSKSGMASRLPSSTLADFVSFAVVTFCPELKDDTLTWSTSMSNVSTAEDTFCSC
ncbi:hypothetical protein DPMN_046172 [Dreissena polymorpha]|uniref:Uncharacterized protein n=1 Tax=Dreissena polymorpha TaxID=45954 RepID=A0A9D4D7D7_DREPO|nr:hypothetical protein DPMN_046172 [Dreissena polymorpha]